MNNTHFEDEEMLRLAEEQKVRLQDTATDTDATGSDEKVDLSGTRPEPYEFEPYAPWSMEIIEGTITQQFCTHCKHRAPDKTGCAQGMCDTLDRVEGRLWKVGEWNQNIK